METFKRTPLQLFTLPQHFLIPLFQRTYVWKEDEQWEPLWKDIRRVTELRINEPHRSQQHFLGAVVLQAHESSTHQVTTWNVIDGQQRLTTLQLLMDATSAIFSQNGDARLASQLDSLTHNSPNFLPEGESCLKVRHLNLDRGAFDEVMTSEPPVDHASLKHSDSKLVQAHRYFSTMVAQWLGDPGSEGYGLRAELLANVLQSDLQLVTIELLAAENSQEIFETLNARGTPLTAADLVRNFVFQRVAAEGGDTKKAYRQDWPFEAKFWAKDISVGRFFVSRSSLFLNQWLTSRIGQEVRPHSTFAHFKSYVEHHLGQTVADLLPILKEQADLYEAWTEAAARPGGNLSVVEMAVYRMQVSGVELLKPLLIWLHEPGRDLSQQTIDRIVSAAESWIMRRQLLRLSGSDLGRIIADIIKTYSGTPAGDLADHVIAYIARLNVTSTYWPGDDEIRAVLEDEAVYRRYPRARLRLFLEAIENSLRSETGQPQIERTGFPIEHVLPQKWQDNWPVKTPEHAWERQLRVHRLGNLTLLTGKLNLKVSNGSWTDKRKALLEHNTIKLTGRLVESAHELDWDESLIDQRTTDLVSTLLKVWSVPDGHQGQVVDPQAKAQDWVEIKHLIAAGMLAVGDRLRSTHRDFAGVEATILSGGRLEVDGVVFDSPSGAGRGLRKKATNGWYFWGLPDGRKLRDVRAEYASSGSSEPMT